MKKNFRFFGLLIVVLAVTLLSACGGSIDSTLPGTSLVAAPADNSIPIIVDGGLGATRTNQPYVSITLCRSASTDCETVDHILLDSGSTGLRLFASALGNPALYGTYQAASDPLLVECYPFGSGSAWGALRKMDLRLGAETAHNLPVQIINDPALSVPAPASCIGQSGGGVSVTTDLLGGNGILGIKGSAVCGQNCATNVGNGLYFSCTETSCVPATVAIQDQDQNPVQLFGADNNGVMITLPAPKDGTATLTGKLVFGIGTQKNNQLGSATVYPLDSDSKLLGIVNGMPMAIGFDTGSAGTYYNASQSLSVCKVPGLSDNYYCGGASLATIQFLDLKSAQNKTVAPLGKPFTMQFRDPLQYQAMYPGSAVNIWLSGPTGGTNTPDSKTAFLGLPFFMGRSVFLAVDGAQTPGGTGPFIAF
ncbi:DUF3443 family protein [Burkholderia metallica]|uniref:DUF3443 family protein n=1 Tax=Burkholderia metallica TaxID=488729 RepID=UPI00157B20D9|nr:DUF3443 family protein [Burkholderia metallica]NTZ89041.1 DUF3443 family protein [Burkholderia metallica]